MTHSTSLTRVCLFLSVFAAGCGSSIKDNPQGAGAKGGADAASGGSTASSGGTTTGSGGSNGGDTSAGGTSVSAGGTTATDAGVAGSSNDGGLGSPDGSAPGASCRTNADCATVPGKLLCEAATGKCIGCHTGAQCGNDEECVNTVCTTLPKCSSSLDCASAPGGKTICDKTNDVCVQCTADADCGTNKVCTTDRVCAVACSSDNDCTAKHMLCNQNIGFNARCTQCVVDADCKAGTYCESGSCVPQTCHPSQQSCDGDLAVECNTAGNGVTPLTQCTLVLFSSCIVVGNNAKCVGACENARLDALETDIDCGGPACSRCSTGKACVLPTDCSSNKCTSSKCE